MRRVWCRSRHLRPPTAPPPTSVSSDALLAFLSTHAQNWPLRRPTATALPSLSGMIAVAPPASLLPPPPSLCLFLTQQPEDPVMTRVRPKPHRIHGKPALAWGPLGVCPHHMSHSPSHSSLCWPRRPCHRLFPPPQAPTETPLQGPPSLLPLPLM